MNLRCGASLRPRTSYDEVLVNHESLDDAAQDVDDEALFGEPEEPAQQEPSALPEEADAHGAERRILPPPGEPTQSDIMEHCAQGHWPYRSWCRECVAGRGTGEQHRARRGERRVCVLSFDYLFLDRSGKEVSRARMEEGEDVDHTILVVKDS